MSFLGDRTVTIVSTAIAVAVGIAIFFAVILTPIYVIELDRANKLSNNFKCYIIFTVKDRDFNTNDHQEVFSASMYFLGRIDTQVSQKDLPTRMLQESRGLRKAQIYSETKRCYAEIDARGDALRKTGAAIGSAMNSRR